MQKRPHSFTKPIRGPKYTIHVSHVFRKNNPAQSLLLDSYPSSPSSKTEDRQEHWPTAEKGVAGPEKARRRRTTRRRAAQGAYATTTGRGKARAGPKQPTHESREGGTGPGHGDRRPRRCTWRGPRRRGALARGGCGTTSAQQSRADRGPHAGKGWHRRGAVAWLVRAW